MQVDRIWLTGPRSGLDPVNHILFYVLYFIDTSLVFPSLSVF